MLVAVLCLLYSSDVVFRLGPCPVDVALHGGMFEADGGLCRVCVAVLGCVGILTGREACHTVFD